MLCRHLVLVLLSARAAVNEKGPAFDLLDWQRRQNRTDHLTLQLGLIDRNGMSGATTRGESGTRYDLSDREHFRYHLDASRDDLFISKPVLGRSTGKWSVQMTRKVLDARGQFDGVIMVSLDCDELSRFYETLDIGQGFVVLAGLDGIVRARGPLTENAVGADLSTGPLMAPIQEAWQGSLQSTHAVDGIERIVSFRRLQDYPFVVLIGFDRASVFARYERSRARSMATGAMTTLVAAILGWLWIRQTQRWIASRRALKVTLESISQGIVMVDADGRLPVVNQRAIDLLDLQGELLQSVEGAGSSLIQRTARNRGILGLPTSVDTMADGHDGTYEKIANDGRIIEVRSHSVVSGGKVLTYTDITDRKLADARIRHLAHHDGLTGLPNRILLTERIADAVALAETQGRRFAVLCLDLDGFKVVNDTMGHDVGDLLLVHFAERLRSVFRPGDTVARIGGDEFTILLRDLAERDTVERLIQRLQQCLVEPVSLEGYSIIAVASIGAALYPDDGLDARTLVKNADTALYRAKDAGRGAYRFFDRSMDASIQERRQMEQDLRMAVEQDRLDVYFQPQFARDTLAVVGFEALVRWNDPLRGFVPPGIFIPIAEDSGLIIDLGRRVLEKACALASAWHPRYRIAVNLSPVQFRDGRLPSLVAEVLANTGLPPELLELEVTEGVLIGDEDQALSTLRALKSQGLRIALDDFGTGYSSLSYLRRFPFDKIKIDKSFVQAQQHDTASQAIMEAVLMMSARLKLSVTVEGVETEAQLAMLRQQQCTELQGYLLGRPMPASEVPRFLAMEAKVASADGSPAPARGASEAAD